MTEDEYMTVYHEAVHRLQDVASGLKETGLEPDDIASVFLTVGMQVLRIAKPDQISSEWLRMLANALDNDERPTH